LIKFNLHYTVPFFALSKAGDTPGLLARPSAHSFAGMIESVDRNAAKPDSGPWTGNCGLL